MNILETLLNKDKHRVKQLENFIIDLCNLGGLENHMELVPLVLTGRVVTNMAVGSTLSRAVDGQFIVDHEFIGVSPVEAFLQREHMAKAKVLGEDK